MQRTRFDKRHRRGDSDGDDFAQFVGELLRKDGRFGNLRSYDSGSVDGSIDFYSKDSGTVCECKFVSQSVKDESERVESEWRGVSAKLAKNLLSENGKAKPLRSPYSPWADVSNPIKQYLFVTSARMANLATTRALQGEIQKFFREVIGGRPGYAHLQKIDVAVLDWTSLIEMLELAPALNFRWLRQWPTGYSEISETAPSGFKAYLYGDKLPYLERNHWSPPEGQRHRWTEDTIISELASGRHPGLIISGPGGVGKTRLALELAKMLGQKGWLTIQCDGLRATAIGLREILAETTDAQQFVLLADYIENWPNLEAFLNEITDLNEFTQHQVVLLGTCRSSFRDRLPDSVRQHRIGDAGEFEVGYGRAVARHILTMAGVGDVEALAVKCRFNLALATFLLFLKAQRASQFEAELDELRSSDDFESWIVRRLRLVKSVSMSAAAALMAACDLPTKMFDALAVSHGANPDDLRSVLAADKWLERVTNADGETTWSVFHDIFTDVLLTRSFSVASDAEHWAEVLLEKAALANCFQRTLASLTRSINHPALRAIDWLTRLRAVERSVPGSLAINHRIILSENFLPASDRLDLISSYASLRHAVEETTSSDVNIVLTVRALAPVRDEGSPYYTHLLPLLDRITEQKHSGNLVARIAFEAEPERYRDTVREWIHEHPAQPQTHYLLNAWLTQAADVAANDKQKGWDLISEAEQWVFYWLQCHPQNSRAQFVYSPWFFAAFELGGSRSASMVESVFDKILLWLAVERNATGFRAADMYLGWWLAVGQVPEVLGVRMASTMLPFTRRWLDLDVNKSHNAYIKIMDAVLVFAGRAPSSIAKDIVGIMKGPVVNWLSEEDNQVTQSSAVLASCWIRGLIHLAPQDVLINIWVIEDYAKRWLSIDNNFEQEATRRLLENWLHACNVLDQPQRGLMAAQLEPYVERWSRSNDSLRAEFSSNLLRWWINLLPDNRLHEALLAVRRWLEFDHDSEGVSLVLSKLNDRGVEIEEFSSLLFDKVRVHSSEEGFSWLLKIVGRFETVPPEVEGAALAWCVRFPRNPDTLGRLNRLVDRRSATPEILTFTIAYVLIELDPASLSANQFGLSFARKCLVDLFHLSYECPLAMMLCKIYFVRWLKAGCVFAPADYFGWDAHSAPVFDQHVDLAALLSSFLEEGEFGNEEREQIALFRSWIAEWVIQPRALYALRTLDDALQTVFGKAQF